MTQSARMLSVWERLVIYSLMGPACEVCFTALWRLIEHQDNIKLHGNSHIYAIPIYGLWALACERMFLAMQRRIPFVLRGFIYMATAFVWEYTFGWTLKLFDACPWNYEEYFAYHVHGLITIEYTPLWYFMGLFAEQLVVKNVLRLRLLDGPILLFQRRLEWNESTEAEP